MCVFRKRKMGHFGAHTEDRRIEKPVSIHDTEREEDSLKACACTHREILRLLEADQELLQRRADLEHLVVHAGELFGFVLCGGQEWEGLTVLTPASIQRSL